MRGLDLFDHVVGIRRATVSTDGQRAIQVLRWLCLLLLVAVALIVTRQVGETNRTHRVVAAQRADIDRVVARLEREIKADCAFKLTVAKLPALSPRPTAVLVDLARAAELAYLEKGCPSATNPLTGRVFGPPPKIPAAVPTATPRR